MFSPSPFTPHLPDSTLADLRARLARTLFADDLPGAGWDDGTPAAHLREQVDHWLHRYDWRAHEARLAAHPQWIAEVGGARVHFLHVRSPEPDATPAILTHGWPASVFEWLDVLGPLTDPRAHGGDPRAALHLVVPSLPGYGFSGPTQERGFGRLRIAGAWAALMDGLGYPRFLAVGNDWGSEISLVLARRYPERVAGAHVTQIFDSVVDAEARLARFGDPTPEERAALAGEAWFHANMSAYHHVQAQQPMSLAHAVTDSPAGWLGWLNIVFRGGMDLDFALTQATVAWATGTIASGLRLYLEAFREEAAVKALPPSRVPVALANFANDTVSIRRLAEETHQNLVAWSVHATGSHWAAHSAPREYVADVQAFVRRVTAG